MRPSTAAKCTCFALLACVAGTPALWARAPKQRQPVPGPEAQKQALEIVEEVYRKEYKAATDSAGKIALARELIDQAGKNTEDAAAHYVLLRAAEKIAAQGGDAALALECAGRTARAFDVDATAVKVDCLTAVRRATLTSSQSRVLARKALELIEVVLGDDDYEAAKRLGEMARAAARKARDYRFTRDIAQRMRDVERLQEAYAAYREACKTLVHSPADPEANLAAGRYLCLTKGDWVRGVPLLALGSDAALSEPATKELEGPASAEEQAALGDAWWDLAEAAEGAERDAFRLRAGIWYRRAETGLAFVLARVKVKKRLKEIARLGLEIPAENGLQPYPAVAPFDAEQAKQWQRCWAEHLEAPVVETNSIGIKLVLIPPGEFEMGSSREEIDEIVRRARAGAWGQWFLDTVPTEGPRHRVRIAGPFRAGVFEVTVGQFRKFVDATGYRTDAEKHGRGGWGYFGPDGPRQRWQQRPEFTWRSPGFRQTDDHPVVDVTHADAGAFCRWLSEKEARTYRLPTEAEWEYACRAGMATRYYFGDEEAALGRHAWWAENSRRAAHPVGLPLPRLQPPRRKQPRWFPRSQGDYPLRRTKPSALATQNLIHML